MVGWEQDDVETMYKRQVTKKIASVMADNTHPLYPDFDSRFIERSGRFRLRVPSGRTDRYRHSFIPTALHLQAHTNLQTRKITQTLTLADPEDVCILMNIFL